MHHSFWRECCTVDYYFSMRHCSEDTVKFIIELPKVKLIMKPFTNIETTYHSDRCFFSWQHRYSNIAFANNLRCGLCYIYLTLGMFCGKWCATLYGPIPNDVAGGGVQFGDQIVEHAAPHYTEANESDDRHYTVNKGRASRNQNC